MNCDYVEEIVELTDGMYQNFFYRNFSWIIVIIAGIAIIMFFQIILNIGRQKLIEENIKEIKELNKKLAEAVQREENLNNKYDQLLLSLAKNNEKY